MVTISAQFNGPDRSGNGGYVAGMLAQEHAQGSGAPHAPVTSTLRIPPPLDVPLTWEHDGDHLRLLTTGGAIVGEATSGEFLRPAPAMATPDQARAAQAAYPGHHNHPFSRCFTCGPDRDEGDGLRLFTGPVGDGRTAALWTAHHAFAGDDGLISTPIMWAALDCPGGWAADFTAQTMVLGRMTAQVLRAARPDEQLISVGSLADVQGRKFLTDTALYALDGDLIGRAEQVWIKINIDDFS